MTFQPRLRLLLLAPLLLMAAMLAALAGSGPAQAQGGDNDYVDVGLTLEIPHGGEPTSFPVNIVVVNDGTRTAYDVKVVADVVYPNIILGAMDHKSGFSLIRRFDAPVGSLSLDGTALHWTIPVLGRGQREELAAEVKHSKSVGSQHVGNSSYPHEVFVEVTTASFDSNRENDTDRIWTYRHQDVIGTRWREVLGNYTVDVSVDNISPSPGGIAKFTVIAGREDTREGGIDAPPVDMKVDIELTGGLSVTGTPTYVSDLGFSTKPDSVNYSNGVFTIGTLQRNDARINSVTLPVTVADGVALNEQCLTARLTGNPPPGTGPDDDDISDNVAELCLGDQPANPLANAQVDAFNIYPCVGSTDPPCDDTDDVRVRAVNTAGSNEDILRPGSALIHAQDQPNRKYDSHANSVNGSNMVSWQIPVIWDATEFDAVNAQWTNLRDGFTISGINGETPPGGVHIRAFEGETYEVIYKMTSSTMWSYEDTVGFNPGTDNGPYTYIAEFEKLGTYKLQYTAKLTRATRDGDEDCDPDSNNFNQRFCATETYTFHVGPIADLAVEDGGASRHVPADRNALSIVAVNNGPDELPTGARVTGLPQGTEVIHVSQGSYDASTGVWDTGELKHRGYYGSRGEPEPTLVLGASAGDAATVSIASAENYEVCIGSDGSTLSHTTQTACEAVTGASWHSGTVYDHRPDNNTATIRAQAGTGEPPEGQPTLKTMGDPESIIAVMWEPVATVNGWPVSHYQVQKLSSPWKTVAEVELTQYLDTDPGEDSVYRVRAVNLAGVPGPWSAPIGVDSVTFRTGVTVRAAYPLEVKEGGRAEYWVGLDGPPESEVTIAITSGNPDITATPQPLRFTTGNWRQEQKVTVRAAQDDNDIPDQTRLTHTVSSDDPAYQAIRPNDVTVHVTDDEEGKDRLKVYSQYRPGGVCYRWLPERVNSMKVTRNNARPSQYCRPRSGPGDKANNVEEYGGAYTGVEYRFGVTVPAGDTLDLKAAFEGLATYPPAANVELYQASTTYDTAGRNPFYSEGYYSPGPGTLMGSYDHSTRQYTASGLTTGLYRLRLHCPGSPGPNAVHPWDCVIGHHMYFDLIWGGGASGDSGGPSGDSGETGHARQWTEHHYAAGSPHRVRTVVNYGGPGQVEAELFHLAGSPAQRLCQASGSGTFTLCEQDVEAGTYLAVVYADADDHTVEFQAADPFAPRLAGLSLDNIVLAFNPDTAGYAVQVPQETAETVIRATTAGEGASVSATVNGAAVNVGDTIALAAGETLIAVTVSGADGSLVAAYTITVTRAAYANQWQIYIGPDSGTRPAAGEEQIPRNVKVFVRCNGELRFDQETCPFEPGSIAFQIQADGSGPLEATHRDDFGGPRQPFVVGQEPDSDFAVALVNLRSGSGDVNYVLTDADRQDLERYLDRVEHVAGAEYIPFVLLRNGSEALGQAWFQLKPAEGTPPASNRPPDFDASVVTFLELAENNPAGTGVGSAITATDPDGDTLSYSLSGADAASFDIGGGSGQITARSGVTYDYEAKPSYELTVNASDGRGGAASIAVTVNLADVNEAPVFAGPSATRAVAENSPAGTSVGTAVTATDPDTGDTLTYSLAGTDAGSFDIDSATGQITTKSGVEYDYGAKSSYSLSVLAMDGGGLLAGIAVTINLSDVEEATPVTACFTDLGALIAAVEYAGAWDDGECKAHHQDSRGRYFQFTLPEETVVTITLTPESGGALYVSNDTPQNGWGTEPKSTYEDRRRIRRDNGKLVHDGPHAATAENDGNTVALTLTAGETYTVEAAGDSGNFTVSIVPHE